MFAALSAGEQGSRVCRSAYVAGRSEQPKLSGEQKAFPIEGFDRGTARFRREAQAELEERIRVRRSTLAKPSRAIGRVPLLLPRSHQARCSIATEIFFPDPL